MNNEFYAFGEILWDCLPSGRHAGGAPFNVAAHLAQLGVAASLVSAVGQDPLGDEILQVAHDKNVDTRFVSRVRIGLPTGTVIVRVDASGNAVYELVQPVAWDEIRVPAAALAAVEASRAFIFGSLAGRSPYNLEQLDRLLALRGPVKFFDVNLRPPFAEPPQIVALARRADVLKLNHDELGQMAAYLRTGEAAPNFSGRSRRGGGGLRRAGPGDGRAAGLRHDGRGRRGPVGRRQGGACDRAGDHRQRHRRGGRRFHGRADGGFDARRGPAGGAEHRVPVGSLRRLAPRRDAAAAARAGAGMDRGAPAGGVAAADAAVTQSLRHWQPSRPLPNRP